MIVTDVTSPAAQRGTGRLLQQYKDASTVGVREVVAQCSNEVQDCTDMMYSFGPGFNINTATGVQLDLLGKIVGEPRKGRTDDQYRLWIQAKIRVNRSNGTTEDIIDVFRILTGGATSTAVIQVIEYYPGKISVKVNSYNVVYSADFAAILRLARKAGVGATLEYSTAPSGFGFVFLGGVGMGFPNAALTPGTGGKFAGAI